MYTRKHTLRAYVTITMSSYYRSNFDSSVYTTVEEMMLQNKREENAATLDRKKLPLFGQVRYCIDYDKSITMRLASTC